jgi:enoyl-CoA hydratase/carnithine racemase
MAPIVRADADGIVTLTFTRPEKLNAISPQMWNFIRDNLDEFAGRDDLRALVITAEGRYFTAGNDQVERDDLLGRSGPPIWFREGVHIDEILKINIRREYRRLHLLFDEFEAVEKPIIVAVQGRCLGVGVEMAVSCDFRLASDEASFWVPEIVRVGALPGSGGISRLTRLVGPHWARWLSMAGQEVPAELALTMGLVHAVYPAETFAADVQAFARKLIEIPADLLGAAKLGIDMAADVDRTSARNFDRLANTIFLTSPGYLQQKLDFERRSSERSQRPAEPTRE